MLFTGDILAAEYQGGGSLLASFDRLEGASLAAFCLLALSLGASLARLLLQADSRRLAFPAQSAISRALSSSIFLVPRAGAGLATVADDVFDRALDASLEDAVSVLRASGAAPALVTLPSYAREYYGPQTLVPVPVHAHTISESALLSTVLAEDESR
jgi:hypothetical protein